MMSGCVISIQISRNIKSIKQKCVFVSSPPSISFSVAPQHSQPTWSKWSCFSLQSATKCGRNNISNWAGLLVKLRFEILKVTFQPQRCDLLVSCCVIITATCCSRSQTENISTVLYETHWTGEGESLLILTSSCKCFHTHDLQCQYGFLKTVYLHFQHHILFPSLIIGQMCLLLPLSLPVKSSETLNVISGSTNKLSATRLLSFASSRAVNDRDGRGL